VIKTLTAQIEEVLQIKPETRNSDKMLTWAVCQRFYGTGYAITRDQFMDLPSEDNVKRIRAKFNSEMLYLPTSQEVAEARGIKEEEWREALGCNKTADTKEELF